MRLPFGILVKIGNSSNYYWKYYDSATGNKDRRSTRTSDRREAERIASRWATEYLATREGMIAGGDQSATATTPVPVTLGQALSAYLQHYDALRSTRHIDNLIIYYNRDIIPFFGDDCSVAEIKTGMINRFAKSLSERLKSQSVNKILSYLSTVLKYAAANEWIERLPYIQRLPEQEQEHGLELTDGEIARLRYAAKTVSDDAQRFVVLCVYCGMRKSEALRAQWEDVDFDAGLIWLGGGQKNKQADPAPLGRPAREILERVPLSERNGVLVGHSRRVQGTRQPVAAIRKTWDTVLDRAGLGDVRKRNGKRIGAHDLRHTFVSRVFRLLGYDARHLSRHSNQEAFIRYLHTDRDAIRKRIDEVF